MKYNIVNILVYGNGLDVAVYGTEKGCEVWTDCKAFEADRRAKAAKEELFHKFLASAATEALEAAQPSNFWSAWNIVKAAAEKCNVPFSCHKDTVERFCLSYLYN